jgi:hypothetical protein
MPSNEPASGTGKARALFRRHWLRGVWGNPLARSADRWQAGLRIVLISLWALALPLAATVSSLLVANGLQSIDQATGEATQTSAVLSADAPRITMFGDGVAPVVADHVPASWTAQDGTTRSGPVSAFSGMSAGERVDIWIDSSGTKVDTPKPPSGAVGEGILVGVAIWLGWGILLALVFWLSVLSLDRGRRAEWDREWRGLAPH